MERFNIMKISIFSKLMHYFSTVTQNTGMIVLFCLLIDLVGFFWWGTEFNKNHTKVHEVE